MQEILAAWEAVGTMGGRQLDAGTHAGVLGELRGWAIGLNVPVVMMIGYRGWTRHGVNTDTAATYTERFLHAFGISYYLCESSADAPRCAMRRTTGHPREPFSSWTSPI